MCGDSAGTIHPLCGNGMSMAIRSAQIASHLIIDYLQGKIASRVVFEKTYQKLWNNEFKTRLKVGHFASKLLSKNQLAEVLIRILNGTPILLQKIIKQTHGKPMVVK